MTAFHKLWIDLRVRPTLRGICSSIGLQVRTLYVVNPFGHFNSALMLVHLRLRNYLSGVVFKLVHEWSEWVIMPSLKRYSDSTDLLHLLLPRLVELFQVDVLQTFHFLLPARLSSSHADVQSSSAGRKIACSHRRELSTLRYSFPLYHQVSQMLLL